jgi:hypothetical protein
MYTPLPEFSTVNIKTWLTLGLKLCLEELFNTPPTSPRVIHILYTYISTGYMAYISRM